MTSVLVYAKRKLNSAEKDLESAIDSMSYSCGLYLKMLKFHHP